MSTRPFALLRPLLPSLFALASAVSAEESRPLVVITTNTILADMTREICGDRAEVRCLVTPGVDLHGFDPTPRDIGPLLQADLVVANGAGFEPWLGNFLGATGYDGPVVTASEGCAMIATEEGSADEDHHDHGESDSHHGEMDPHAWHDPANGIRYVANIADALVRIDPASAETYRRRARLYTGQIETLETWARRLFALVPADRRHVVTSHDSLAYFGRAFGLQIVPLRGLDSRTEPDAQQIARVVDALRQQQASALFLENATQSRMLEQIARDTGARLGKPLFTDSLGGPDSPASGYLAMLRENTLRILDAIEKK